MSQLLLVAPKEPSCLLPYFDVTEKQFKNNRSTYEAWCLGCLRRQIATIVAEDRLAAESDDTRVVRSDAEAEDLARSTLSNMPISSALETLTSHVKSCRDCVPEVDRSAILAKRQQQRDLESLRRGRRVFGNVTNTVGVPSVAQYSPALPVPLAASPTASAFGQPLPTAAYPPPPQAAAPAGASLRRTDTVPDLPSDASDCQREFAADLCRLFVALNLAWNAVSHPETKAFFAKWLPKLRLPDRHTLAGPLLRVEKQKAIVRVRSKVADKFVTLQCDGWRNIARIPIITSMMSVGGQSFLLRSHSTFGQPKTGEYLWQLMQADYAFALALFSILVIAICTDDGPDGKKMRRLARTTFPAWIVVVCWAHQNQLIIGDLIRHVPMLKLVIEQALSVAKWFLNHGVALSLLHETQARDPDVSAPVNPLLPAATRWGANYFSVSRLLRLRGAINWVALNKRPALLEIKSRSDDDEGSTKAEEIVDLVSDNAFWTRLESAKSYMEPLAISSLVLQRSGLRLDQVLLTIANLFRIYNNPLVDNCVRVAVHESLERRWKAADQEVFILAVLFNPYIRTRAFSDTHLTRSQLANMCRRMYERFYSKPVSLAFWTACQKYLDGAEPFTAESMMLRLHESDAQAKDNDIDLVAIWGGTRSVHAADPDAVGLQELVQMAMRILSVVAASTACEKNFSAFGIIHSKLRNRLDVSSTHDINFVRMDINSGHAEAGRQPRRALKRKHGDINASSASSASSIGSSTSTETRGAGASTATASERDPELRDEALVAEAHALRESDGVDELSGDLTAFEHAIPAGTDDDEEVLPPVTPLPNIPPADRPPPYRKIKLCDLMLYPDHGAADTADNSPLLTFWNGEVKNLADEEMVHEAAQGAV